MRRPTDSGVGGYVVEGHVPAKDIRRLLKEKPDAVGIAAPGMPVGSPGMEQSAEFEPYDVLLIRKDGATEVFAKHARELEDMGSGEIFHHSAFHYVESVDASIRLNSMSGAIILAASGMCEAGRIRHHLRSNLPRSDSTVLFVGFQAQGTLGRRLGVGVDREAGR
mgnify:CR=1 FL=1